MLIPWSEDITLSIASRIIGGVCPFSDCAAGEGVLDIIWYLSFMSIICGCGEGVLVMSNRGEGILGGCGEGALDIFPP